MIALADLLQESTETTRGLTVDLGRYMEDIRNLFLDLVEDDTPETRARHKDRHERWQQYVRERIAAKDEYYLEHQDDYLRPWNEDEDFHYFSRDEVEPSLEKTKVQAEEQIKPYVDLVSRALELLRSKNLWQEFPLVLRPNYNLKGEYSTDINGADISFQENSMVSFTIFLHDGELIVDDILEGGDTDIFEGNDALQGQYFLLIKALQKPESLSRERILRLFTARPRKDREMYDLNPTQIPTNIFLTSKEDSAEGLAVDLMGGDDTKRDIYILRISDRYLQQTVDAGSERWYQVVSPTGEKMVPVQSLQRIISLDETTIKIQLGLLNEASRRDQTIAFLKDLKSNNPKLYKQLFDQAELALYSIRGKKKPKDRLAAIKYLLHKHPELNPLMSPDTYGVRALITALAKDKKEAGRAKRFYDRTLDLFFKDKYEKSPYLPKKIAGVDTEK